MKPKDVLITLAVLVVAFVLGGVPPTLVAELTAGELAIVGFVSAAIAAVAFISVVRWLRDESDYVGALLATAVISLLVAGIVTDRVRGPACLGEGGNDPSLCKAPPPSVIDRDAWWQGWAAADGLMIAAGCLGAVGGAVVKLEIQRAGR